MMSLKSYFGADSGTGTQHTSGGRWDRSDKPTSNPPPFPDHHHYHSFIIKRSDKTTSLRPHHASFRQILKYPINFLSGSKVVSENCGRTHKFKCVKTLIYPQ